MNETLPVFLSSDDAEFRAAVSAVSDRIRLVDSLADAEIACGWLSPADIQSAPNLRWFQTLSAGVNRWMTSEIRGKDFIITNVSGIHAEPITEHMFGMLLMWTRRLTDAWEAQKKRAWKDDGGRATMLTGKTLGILGVGAIGSHSARVGKAFGMRVLGLRRSGGAHPDIETMFTPETKLDFLRECDVVMNSLPLTEKTRGFLGADEFAVMKPDAIVINTGRGATIDTAALIDALNAEKLGAALLDVTDPEPLPPEHPLWTAKNVVITAHYSGSHPEYDKRAGKIFLENLQRYVSGETLENIVDKTEGY